MHWWKAFALKQDVRLGYKLMASRALLSLTTVTHVDLTPTTKRAI